jgi:hypothetical protein
MKWVLTVWGLVFLVFLVILGARVGIVEPATPAARDLPAAHLLQNGDLKSGTANAVLVGRYLRRPVAKDQVLTPRDTSPAPIIPADAGPVFPIAVPRPSIDDNSLNARKPGEFCRKAVSVAKGEVVAALCPAANDLEKCVALIQVLPPGDLGKVVTEFAKQNEPPLEFKLACKP